jgi:energy-coupling factor transporter ATP-binding protein EcfA2
LPIRRWPVIHKALLRVRADPAAPRRRVTLSTQSLVETVRARLDADESVGDEWGLLVLAALEGDAALEALLTSSAEKKSATREADPPHADAQPTADAPAAGAYLHSIRVEGFRGIGPQATLELPPGPGLTLVVGRNGSGKSSFAEALELLLTGDTFRWAQRSKVWRDGWRNLHHTNAAVASEIVLEGQPGRCRVERQWPEAADLDAGATHVQLHGRPRSDLASLGWQTALANYRPFLSYNELGSLLDDGPSTLYDALASILGLEELVAAQATLQQARSNRERAKKNAASRRDQIVATLADLPDERAQAAGKALDQKDWGLDDVAVQLEGAATPEDAGELATLRALAALQAPSEEAVTNVTTALRAAARALSEAAGTLAARSHDLAALLDHALRFHGDYGDGPCPVCGRDAALDKAWHKSKSAEMESLRADAASAADAKRRAEQALAAARNLAPAAIPDTHTKAAAALGLDLQPALQALAAWPQPAAALATTEACRALANHPARRGSKSDRWFIIDAPVVR